MIQRDRNGETYRLDINPLPPPSSDKVANRLYYQLKESADVINELLDRVHELEMLRKTELLSHVPEPSGLED